MPAARNAPLRRRGGALDPDRLVPRSRRALRATAVYAALVVLSLFILLPIGWMLTAALKPDTATIFTFPPEFIPTEYWRWENFVDAPVSYTHLRAHETRHDLVCRLLLEKKKNS